MKKLLRQDGIMSPSTATPNPNQETKGEKGAASSHHTKPEAPLGYWPIHEGKYVGARQIYTGWQTATIRKTTDER